MSRKKKKCSGSKVVEWHGHKIPIRVFGSGGFAFDDSKYRMLKSHMMVLAAQGR